MRGDGESTVPRGEVFVCGSANTASCSGYGACFQQTRAACNTNLADLGAGEGNIKILKMENPPTRQAGTTVPDVATLIDKLRNDAKVI